MTTLRFGFSPCPNDTFAFHALVSGIVDAPCTIEPVMADIEALNQRAEHGELELTKLSFGALSRLSDQYVPLRAGAALGRGVGPLVVARSPMTLEQAAGLRIAVPGAATTAFLLLRLAVGSALGEVVELRYDQILGAVARGDVDAGLIIHESRFTYADHGLVQVADMGEWWERTSGLPLPLGVICARADVAPQLRTQLETAIHRSVRYAFDHPDASAAFISEHAQELAPEVQRRHIELYVNEYTLDIGDEGQAAMAALLDAARG